MTELSPELTCWKDICQYMRVRSRNTAWKRLKKMGLLKYEDRHPVLNVVVFEKVARRKFVKVE